MFDFDTYRESFEWIKSFTDKLFRRRVEVVAGKGHDAAVE